MFWRFFSPFVTSRSRRFEKNNRYRLHRPLKLLLPLKNQGTTIQGMLSKGRSLNYLSFKKNCFPPFWTWKLKCQVPLPDLWVVLFVQSAEYVVPTFIRFKVRKFSELSLLIDLGRPDDCRLTADQDLPKKLKNNMLRRLRQVYSRAKCIFKSEFV
jgi:hypothetical protein